MQQTHALTLIGQSMRPPLIAIGDPCEASWRVSLCGLRRSEVLGLRWSYIDLVAGTVSVKRSRTPRNEKNIGGEASIVDDPKRPKSYRTIPLSPKDSRSVTR